MRLQLKLITRHPYVKMVDFTFLQPPEISFILKPLIAVNVMDIPVFQDFLDNLIQSALSGFVSPNTFSMDIEEMMNADGTANGASPLNCCLFYSFHGCCKNYNQTSARFAKHGESRNLAQQE